MGANRFVNTGTAWRIDEINSDSGELTNKTIDEDKNTIVSNSTIALRKLIFELTQQGFNFESEEIINELNKLS